MKIQLTKEALERMLGGDTEIEIEVRQQIAEQFAKRYLRDLVNTEAMQAMVKEIKDGLGNSHFITNANMPYQKQIKELCERFVSAKCHDFFESQQVWATMKKRLDDSANWIVSELQESILEKRLDKLVDEKIKERLGLP